ncbi:hypothetical protein RF11_11731 [Thelohanellus kitauei]|uniref:Uncharacterized protein n=1 Tax=Thelohanellus kitauei TaxID=669202 RepID=A0A0C2JB89_THEKT|nr:hypothetical protein RF11_11731 [Thelohanellus kitauei]
MSTEILVAPDSTQKLPCDAVMKACSIDSVIGKHHGVFSKSEDNLRFKDVIKHKIITKNVTPQCSQPYRMPFGIQNNIMRHIQSVLDKNIILHGQRRSSSKKEKRFEQSLH